MFFQEKTLRHICTATATLLTQHRGWEGSPGVLAGEGNEDRRSGVSAVSDAGLLGSWNETPARVPLMFKLFIMPCAQPAPAAISLWDLQAT